MEKKAPTTDGNMSLYLVYTVEMGDITNYNCIKSKILLLKFLEESKEIQHDTNNFSI